MDGHTTQPCIGCAGFCSEPHPGLCQRCPHLPTPICSLILCLYTSAAGRKGFILYLSPLGQSSLYLPPLPGHCQGGG